MADDHAALLAENIQLRELLVAAYEQMQRAGIKVAALSTGQPEGVKDVAWQLSYDWEWTVETTNDVIERFSQLFNLGPVEPRVHEHAAQAADNPPPVSNRVVPSGRDSGLSSPSAALSTGQPEGEQAASVRYALRDIMAVVCEGARGKCGSTCGDLRECSRCQWLDSASDRIEQRLRSFAAALTSPPAERAPEETLAAIKAALTDESLSDGAKVIAAMTYLGGLDEPTAGDIAWAHRELVEMGIDPESSSPAPAPIIRQAERKIPTCRHGSVGRYCPHCDGWPEQEAAPITREDTNNG